MKKSNKKEFILVQLFKRYWYILVILILSIPLIIPYLKSGYFPTHDGEWAVVRLSEMFREIKDGQFPPRYSGYLNFGHGYPLFNFAYPFPYYLGLVFKLIGLDFMESVKAIFALTVPLSGIGMFFAAWALWRNKLGAFVSSILYLYVPYRLVDLYVRGSIGESIAFVLAPLLILSVVCIARFQRYRIISVAFGALFLALLVLTHNIMAVYFIPITILIAGLYSVFSRKLIPYYLGMLFLGIGLSSFFWFPALFEKDNILLSITPIADRSLYFVSLPDLIIPSWGYGIPTDSGDGFSYQLGIPQILGVLAVFGFLLFTYLKKKLKYNQAIIGAYLLLFVWVLMVVMMFAPTHILWESLPLLSEINYPWTLLAPIAFVSSLLVGFLASQNKQFMYAGLGLCLLSIVLVVSYAKPSEYVDRGEGFYSTNDATTTSSSELMPLWIDEFPHTKPISKVEIATGSGTISEEISKSNHIAFTANLDDASTVRINSIYYPGWEIMTNGSSQEFTYDNIYGLMEFELPEGKYTIEARFKETPARLTSDIVSFISLILVSGLLIYGTLFALRKHETRKI